MNNRIRASILVATMLALLVGLTGSTQAAPGQRARTAVTVVHLTYWNMWSGIWTKVVNSMVDDFNRAHPTIQVKPLSVPSNAEQKLLTAVAAGNPPDVFTEWSPLVASFAAKHAVVDLTQFMTGAYTGLNSWFYPVTLRWGSYQGRLYAMPWTMNSFMLYYNKTMMQQAGLDPNKPPLTIAQLDANQAKEWKYGSQGQVTQIGYYPNWFDVWAPTWNVPLLKNGKYDMTNPRAVALMSWIASYKKYPYSQVNSFLTAFNGGNGGSDPFLAGKQGFSINGMWNIPAIQQFSPKLRYGVTALPYPPGGNSGVTWVNGNYNEIMAGSKHQQEAFAFISWLSGYHNEAWAARAYIGGGWIPNSPQITKQPAYQSFLKANPLRPGFVNLMLSPKDDITPVTTAEQLYETTLGNDVTAVLEGKKTPMQALQHVEQVSNQALQTGQ